MYGSGISFSLHHAGMYSENPLMRLQLSYGDGGLPLDARLNLGLFVMQTFGNADETIKSSILLPYDTLCGWIPARTPIFPRKPHRATHWKTG